MPSMDTRTKLIRLFSLEIHKRRIVNLNRIAENSIVFWTWAVSKFGYDECPFPNELQTYVENRIYGN